MSDSGSGSGSNGNQVGSPNPPPAQGPSPLPPPPQPQPQQAPYQPPPQYPQYPQQQYAAPVYAPPAPQQGYQQPMMQQQPGFAPPPAKGGNRGLLIGGIAAAALVVLLAAGGIIGNVSLSSTYSAGKAVQAYFAAQSRGDVSYMVGNANYLKGDNGTDAFFNRDAVAALVKQKENTAVSGVSVSSTQSLDSATSKVTVAMSWNGNAETETYTLHKDPSRTHFIFYNDWKLDIPAETVSVTVPNQAGELDVDGIAMPSGLTSTSVIQGYHTVTMGATHFYDQAHQTANTVDGNASVTFQGKFSDAAAQGAAKAIDDTFANNCDAAKYFDCTGHVYHPSAGKYDILPMPGGDVNAYNSWEFTFVGEPTSGMVLTAATATDQATANGTCTVKLVVDGKSSYTYSGDWKADLSFNGGNWGTDVSFNCDANKV